MILDIFGKLPKSAAKSFSEALLGKGDTIFSSVEVRSTRDGKDDVFVLKAFNDQKVRVVSETSTITNKRKEKKRGEGWVTNVLVTNYKV